MLMNILNKGSMLCFLPNHEFTITFYGCIFPFILNQLMVCDSGSISYIAPMDTSMRKLVMQGLEKMEKSYFPMWKGLVS